MNSSIKPFKMSPKQTTISLALVLVGLVSFVLTLGQDAQRAWSNYLIGYFFWLCISLSGVFFASLQHISGSMWSATIRRLAEVFIAYIPVAIVLFLVLVWGLHSMHHHGIHFFEWMDSKIMDADHLLKLKKAYLNEPFFLVRAGILFAVILGFGGALVKNSLAQDKTGDVALTKKNIKLSAPFILLFAWSFTFVAFDLMMSLAPHWFSTIFGVYCWAGLFQSGLAMIILFALSLKKAGILSDYVTQDHLHDLGKLLFGFTVFWAYIAFSQFMLIWYGNLPEETPYYIVRNTPEWHGVSVALLIIKFVVPFFVLISRPAKRNATVLTVMCLWILFSQWLDIYWMVAPTFNKAPVIGWNEFGIFVGFAGLFFLSVGRFLSKVSPVAVGDPYLKEALHHHQ